MATKRKINHGRRILREKTIHTGNMLPGMILRFGYTGVYDTRPLVLFLYKENNLAHCINLNYLHEYKVQELFDWALRMFEGRIDECFREESFFNLAEGFTRVGFTNKLAPSDVEASEFYNRAIKPRFLKQPSTANCYKTYKLDKISTLKIVNYGIDTWLKYKETGKFSLFGENTDLEEAGDWIGLFDEQVAKQYIDTYGKTRRD